jgi:hypothetical protein
VMIRCYAYNVGTVNGACNHCIYRRLNIGSVIKIM